MPPDVDSEGEEGNFGDNYGNARHCQCSGYDDSGSPAAPGES